MKDQSIIKYLIIAFAMIFFWGSAILFFYSKYLIAVIFFIILIFFHINYEKIRKRDEAKKLEEHE